MYKYKQEFKGTFNNWLTAYKYYKILKRIFKGNHYFKKTLEVTGGSKKFYIEFINENYRCLGYRVLDKEGKVIDQYRSILITQYNKFGSTIREMFENNISLFDVDNLVFRVLKKEIIKEPLFSVYLWYGSCKVDVVDEYRKGNVSIFYSDSIKRNLLSIKIGDNMWKAKLLDKNQVVKSTTDFIKLFDNLNSNTYIIKNNDIVYEFRR